MKTKDMIARAHELLINAAIQSAWEGSAFDQEPEERYADILIELGALEDVYFGDVSFSKPNIFIAYATKDYVMVQTICRDILKTPHHGAA